MASNSKDKKDAAPAKPEIVQSSTGSTLITPYKHTSPIEREDVPHSPTTKFGIPFK